MYWLLTNPGPESPTLSASFLPGSSRDSHVYSFCRILFPPVVFWVTKVHSMTPASSPTTVLWNPFLKQLFQANESLCRNVLFGNSSHGNISKFLFWKGCKIDYENAKKINKNSIQMYISELEGNDQYKNCHKVWSGFIVLSLGSYFCVPLLFWACGRSGKKSGQEVKGWWRDQIALLKGGTTYLHFDQP